MKVKTNANGTSTQCPTAFVSPIFNAYPAFFGNGRADLCADFPVIDIARDTPKHRFAESREEYFSTREYHEGDQLGYVDIRS